MKVQYHDIWPGTDDQLVVVQMLADPLSSHWSECHTFFGHLLQVSGLPVDMREDVVQNCMITVSNSLSTFHFDGRFRNWLAIIARSRIADAWRTQARVPQPFTSTNDPPGEDERESGLFEVKAPQTPEEACILRETVREAVDEMQAYIKGHGKPERNWQIVERVLLEQYTIDEASKELGINAPVVRYVVKCVQRHLRERMGLQPFPPDSDE